MSTSESGVEAPPQPAVHHGVLQPQSPFGSSAYETAAPTEETPTSPHPAGSATLAPRPASVTAEQFIREAMEIIDAARPMPLSTSVMINRDEVMTLLESALAAVPDETRQARWLLRERDEVLAQARVDANLVIDEARSRVAQMVQRTEVVRTAERRARQLLDDARIQTRRRRHEVDEYCERQLAQFASAVDQVQIAVQAARRKLGKRAATPLAPASPSAPPAHDGGDAASSEVSGTSGRGSDTRPPDTHPVVFDQDQM
jgi:vacuolar-type H+-ATPase subunit H